MLFYNFLVIPNKNHLVTNETDYQDGSDSDSESRPIRTFES